MNPLTQNVGPLFDWHFKLALIIMVLAIVFIPKYAFPAVGLIILYMAVSTLQPKFNLK